jgi:hypothetical protein
VKYILDGKQIVEEPDLIKWAKWFQAADRKVAHTEIGNSDISTVFLGMDHSFDGGVPVLFETMIFGGALDGFQKRYRTWSEAEEGHRQAVAQVESLHGG